MWNSCLKKKLRQRGIDPNTHKPLPEMEDTTDTKLAQKGSNAATSSTTTTTTTGDKAAAQDSSPAVHQHQIVGGTHLNHPSTDNISDHNSTQYEFARDISFGGYDLNTVVSSKNPDTTTTTLPFNSISPSDFNSPSFLPFVPYPPSTVANPISHVQSFCWGWRPGAKEAPIHGQDEINKWSQYHHTPVLLGSSIGNQTSSSPYDEIKPEISTLMMAGEPGTIWHQTQQQDLQRLAEAFGQIF